MSVVASVHTSGWYPAAAVMDAARGRWVSVLSKLNVRSEFLQNRHGPCPGCGGKDRFRFDDEGGDGSFICSQGGKGMLAGNGLALLGHVTGWEWRRCVEEVGRMLLGESGRVRGGGAASWHGGRMLVEEGVAELPVAEPMVAVPPYDAAKLHSYVEGMPVVTRDMLREWSPVGVGGETDAFDFMDVLFKQGERVMVFTRFTSQGDFIYQVGAGGCRLAANRGQKAVVSELPTRGRCGVWFLSNPVTGNWDAMANGKWGRRHWKCVTTFRYAVLESDEADESMWLRALVRLPLPIVAIYTSGGKSVHALVRIDATSKAEWDAIVRGKHSGARDGARRGTGLIDLVCPLGADGAALTAVRLSRLPYTLRMGYDDTAKGVYVPYDPPRKQELLYLDPPRWSAKPVWRSIESRAGLKWGGAAL